ncbi:hypothetical protein LXA43DRAFT_1063374 [Ganoderma leucocontextum]|nr:hypothetical protein LXA43DRAFT_1063374 [Ganoderma leucocontextum]
MASHIGLAIGTNVQPPRADQQSATHSHTSASTAKSSPRVGRSHTPPHTTLASTCYPADPAPRTQVARLQTQAAPSQRVGTIASGCYQCNSVFYFMLERCPAGTTQRRATPRLTQFNLVKLLRLPLGNAPPESVTPIWEQVLIENGVPLAWVDELRRSPLNNFSRGARTGAFIEPLEDGTAWMHHVPCMIHANLPVYVHWPTIRAAHSSLELDNKGVFNIILVFPFLRSHVPDLSTMYYVPDVEQEAPRSFPQRQFRWSHLSPPFDARRQLSPASPTSLHVSDGVDLPVDLKQAPHGRGQESAEPFEDFAARRTRLHTRLRAEEKPEDTQRRLERVNKAAAFTRPTRPTKLFLWQEVGDVDMSVPCNMFSLPYRTTVSRSAIAEVWANYPNSQKVYDVFLDEWDICTALAPEDSVEDPWEDYDLPDHHAPTPPVDSTPAFELDLNLFYEDQDAVDYYCPQLQPFAEVSCYRYGLVPTHLDNFSMDTGLGVDHVRKLFNLSDSEWPSANAPHDPDRDLHTSANAFRNHDTIRILERSLSGTMGYLVSYRGDQTDWYIWVDGTTALELIRRHTLVTVGEAAKYLARQGTRFRTLALCEPRVRVRWERPKPCDLGWKPHWFPDKAQRTDYTLYINRVSDFLSLPRARAAVMRGGIIWHIIMDVVQERGLDLAAEGPSQYEDSYHDVLQLNRGDPYFDDGLTEEDLRLICGVYTVSTDSANIQTRDVSWWPQEHHWKQSVFDCGRWSPAAEV